MKRVEIERFEHIYTPHGLAHIATRRPFDRRPYRYRIFFGFPSGRQMPTARWLDKLFAIKTRMEDLHADEQWRGR